MRIPGSLAALLFFATASTDALADGVLVAARMLPLGTVISSEDIKLADKKRAGALSTVADAVGREARRTIFAGRPILAGDLRDPSLVRRNDVVELSYVSGGLSIRTEGRALDRGSAGEIVSVMNLDSRQVVRGIVSGRGRIEVSQ